MTQAAMTRAEIGSATAQLLLSAGAVHVSRERPFILAAGWASPVYIDCRLLIGEAQFRREAFRLAAEAVRTMIKSGSFDAVAGAETAGIPFASWLADALNMPLWTVSNIYLARTGITWSPAVNATWPVLWNIEKKS